MYKCKRCGKPLHDEESIAKGYGPVCCDKAGQPVVTGNRKSRSSLKSKIKTEDETQLVLVEYVKARP